MVKLDERDLYQLLIAECRYAIARDNHLAPGTCIQHIKSYLPEMSTPWRAITAEQLTREIIDERLWNSRYSEPGFKFEKSVEAVSLLKEKSQLTADYEWEELLVFLTNYLTKLPDNVDRYMRHIFGHMTYSAGIDYYSLKLTEI